MKSVEVESKPNSKRERNDLTFFYNDLYYAVELKTPNTNWKINGINSKGRPITKNINSIVEDTKKLNSTSGIVAFVLFPIPVNDNRWEKYIQRISELTGIELKIERDCELIEMEVDNQNKCTVIVCSFMSRKYHNW